jgi:glycosyltransferase involved in cell wall biosynthesis
MPISPVKLSLITVCYNAADLIQATLQSALNQSFKDFELVIIDGGSTDNTLSLLEPFKPYIGALVSEKDKGIYDAMNKGVKLAKGEWVYFLNAGDSFYHPEVLKDVFNHSASFTSDFIYAKVQTLNEPTGVDYVAGEPVSFQDFYFKYPICHQASFAKRKLFTQIGYFETNYKLISDTEWFIRLFRNAEIKTNFIDEVVAFYDITGATYQKRMLGMREYIHAGFKYFPLQIALLNLFSYPIIWLKVKVIRAFQHTFWFKAYRKWKFNKQLAQYSHES